ncbi:secretion protein EssA [Carnobacterium gallinarum]|uniref:hypothetical protein n=1 Tax=Carnobacterium gallinarum TaxID=2749 RepID=UPI000555E4E6|nr:hypothetical protein [Carnobacterium gallinarum]
MRKRLIRFSLMVVMGSCFFGVSVLADTKLAPNELQIKADRIEQNNSVKQNTETTATDSLFNEEQMELYQGIKARAEQQFKVEGTTLFLNPAEKVNLYSASDLFSEKEAATLPITQGGIASQVKIQATGANTQALMFLTIAGLMILIIGAVVSISNYRKGV